MSAPVSPIAFGCEVLRKLIAEQARPMDEGGAMVVMVEDIETMLSGLALAGAALGVTPAPISAPARLALPAPAPERTRRPRRDALSEDERKARKRAQNAAFRAKQKAEAAGGGAS